MFEMINLISLTSIMAILMIVFLIIHGKQYREISNKYHDAESAKNIFMMENKELKKEIMQLKSLPVRKRMKKLSEVI